MCATFNLSLRGSLSSHIPRCDPKHFRRAISVGYKQYLGHKHIFQIRKYPVFDGLNFTQQMKMVKICVWNSEHPHHDSHMRIYGQLERHVYANEENVTKWKMSHTIKPSTGNSVRGLPAGWRSLGANWCGIMGRLRFSG